MLFPWVNHFLVGGVELRLVEKLMTLKVQEIGDFC